MQGLSLSFDVVEEDEGISFGAECEVSDELIAPIITYEPLDFICLSLLL